LFNLFIQILSAENVNKPTWFVTGNPSDSENRKQCKIVQSYIASLIDMKSVTCTAPLRAKTTVASSKDFTEDKMWLNGSMCFRKVVWCRRGFVRHCKVSDQEKQIGSTSGMGTTEDINAIPIKRCPDSVKFIIHTRPGPGPLFIEDSLLDQDGLPKTLNI
ncbi:hypothetical protein KUTeg_018842, partial [Tegillarca granosa]